MADLPNTIIENFTSLAVGIPSVGVIVAYGISIIRRRASADTKIMNEDRSYSAMLDAYRKERDELRSERDRILTRMDVVEDERNSAVAQVGKLTAEVEFLNKQVIELKDLVAQLGHNLELARNEMHRFAIENAKLAARLSYLVGPGENQ